MREHGAGVDGDQRGVVDRLGDRRVPANDRHLPSREIRVEVLARPEDDSRVRVRGIVRYRPARVEARVDVGRPGALSGEDGTPS